MQRFFSAASQNRDPSQHACKRPYGSRLCVAPLRKSYALHRVRDTRFSYTNSAATLPSPESCIATLSPAFSHIVCTRLPVSTICPARNILRCAAR